MKRASVRENYTYNMIYQVLNIILPLITTPYISRVLGADGIGIYSYTYSIVSTFVMVGSMGIGTYGQKEIAAVSDNRSKISIKFWEIQTVKTISVSISMVIFLIMALCYEKYTLYFIIQLPYFIGAILDISWYYQGMENFKLVALRNIVIKLVSLCMIFVLIKNESHLSRYIVILCMAQVLGNLTMWGHLKKFLNKVNIGEFCLRQHIKPTFVYFIPTISYQIYAVLDKAMLGFIYDDTTENGFYEQAHKLINMVTMVISSYTIVMRSRMTVYFAKQDYTNVRRHLERSMHFIGFLVFPMSFGIAAIADNLVPWFFGEGYEKVIVLLYVFSPYFMFMGICTCLGTHILTPSGQQAKSNVGQVISAIVNVCLNAILIPKWGAIGAAFASVTSEAIIVVSYMRYVPDYMTYKKLFGILYKNLLSAIVMFVPTVILSKELPANIINTFLTICVGATIYIVMLILVKDSYLIGLINSVKSKLANKLQEK